MARSRSTPRRQSAAGRRAVALPRGLDQRGRRRRRRARAAAPSCAWGWRTPRAGLPLDDPAGVQEPKEAAEGRQLARDRRGVVPAIERRHERAHVRHRDRGGIEIALVSCACPAKLFQIAHIGHLGAGRTGPFHRQVMAELAHRSGPASVALRVSRALHRSGSLPGPPPRGHKPSAGRPPATRRDRPRRAGPPGPRDRAS